MHICQLNIIKIYETFISILYCILVLLDIMSITILEAHLGRDRSLCLLDGKFVEIQEVEFIMSIIIQEAPRGKGQIQNDYNISNIGKVKDNMSFNKAIKDFFILR